MASVIQHQMDRKMAMNEQAKYSPSLHLGRKRKTEKSLFRISGNQVTAETEYLFNTSLEY
jgi:hypothetical protein